MSIELPEGRHKAMAVPSTTFLFDRYRSGRMPFSKGIGNEPELIWRFRLPSYPPKGPESSPAFDSQVNLYFGAHDGCFYSLDRNGKLRWMFKTGGKIYSSPTVLGERVVVCSGDGHCFCFNLDGNLLWTYYAAGYFEKSKRSLVDRIDLTLTKYAGRDHVRGNKLWTTKCWSSPNITEEGVVYITCYGVGLHALNIRDGQPLWVYDLGRPRNHLSGVALNENHEIFVASQRNYIHSVSATGKRRWRIQVPAGFDAWGNPSIDLREKTVYFPLSRQENEAYIVAVDYAGNIKWTCTFPGGARGSVAISRKNYVLVGGLNGNLYFIDKFKGHIIKSLEVTKAERGLWTTPSIDKVGNIYLTAKETRHSGRLYCFDDSGEYIWNYNMGKTLSVPIVDQDGRLYVGSWGGELLCLQT